MIIYLFFIYSLSQIWMTWELNSAYSNNELRGSGGSQSAGATARAAGNHGNIHRDERPVGNHDDDINSHRGGSRCSVDRVFV